MVQLWLIHCDLWWFSCGGFVVVCSGSWWFSHGGFVMVRGGSVVMVL